MIWKCLTDSPRGLIFCFCFSGGPPPGPRVHHHHHRLWPAQLLQQLRGGGEAVRGPGDCGGLQVRMNIFQRIIKWNKTLLQGPGPLWGAGIPGEGRRPEWGSDLQPLPRVPGPLSGPALPRLWPGVRPGQSHVLTHVARSVWAASLCRCLDPRIFTAPIFVSAFDVCDPSMCISLNGALWALSGYDTAAITQHRLASEISEEFYILL